MAAKKVKNLWENIKIEKPGAGRPPAFKNPQDLLKKALGYFKWVEDNPLQESKLVSYLGSTEVEELPKMRAMTIGGLCLFMGISTQSWETYRIYEEFSGICNQIETNIREQKFTGAAAGLLNHAIIARDLGLHENEQTIIINNNINPEQAMKDRGIPTPDMAGVKDLDDDQD